MMNDDDFLSYLGVAESNSIQSDDELEVIHERNERFYNGGKHGDEVEGESQVKSTDVFDLVESDLPSLVRVFLGNKEIMKFLPINDSKDERQMAEDKTKYINHLIRNQKDSFKTQYDMLKGGELNEFSVLTFGYEEKEVVSVQEFENLSDEEIAEVKANLKRDKGKGAEIEFQETDSPNDIKAIVKKTVGNYFVKYVKADHFVITKGAESVDSAEIVGHDDYPTKSELISMGYDEKTVKELPSVTKEIQTPNGEETQAGNAIDWTGEIVHLKTRFIKADRDGDGIAERLKVIMVGDEILEEDPYEIAPYAVFSAYPRMGEWAGKGRASTVIETQRLKSVLLRQTMNNMYQVNAARMAVNSNVNKDDLLTTRLGGIVRVKGIDNPLNSMAPLPVPFIGDKALMVLQYADSARAQRTGSLLANQALDSDKLGQETATRFAGVEDASKAKTELIARIYAETGYKDLFLGMLWTVKHYQKTSMEVMISGKPLKFDPRYWSVDDSVQCTVGLGAGDDENVLQNMSGLLQLSQQFMAAGLPITDMKKQYNIASRMVKAMDQHDVSEFFNDPEQPVELLQAQLEALQRENAQLQQMAQTNPLAEAEEIKAQADLIKAQATQELNIAKLSESQRQFNEELEAKTNKTIAELEAKYTDMELKYQTDIAGQGQGQ